MYIHALINNNITIYYAMHYYYAFKLYFASPESTIPGRGQFLPNPWEKNIVDSREANKNGEEQ